MAVAKQTRSPKVPEIRKGDTVVVLSGRDAGKRGTVERVIRRQPAASGARSIFRRGSSAGGVSVVVEGINVAKRHTKPNPQANKQGGIVEKAMPLAVSKVAIFNPASKKADRIGFKTLTDGKKVRFFKSNGEMIDA